MQECGIKVVSMAAVFMFCRVISVSGELSPQGVNYEVQALMAIKSQLVDPNNALSDWDISSADPCSWYRVTCSKENLVVMLEIANSELSGSLSPGVGNLSNLEILSLEKNNISGPLPLELGKLSELSSLDLSNNHFIGEIPEALGLMRKLISMKLNNNNLSGVVPVSLAEVHGLDCVDLSYNNLSGPVPHLLVKTLNVTGNPLLCGSSADHKCSEDPPLQVPFSSVSSKGSGTSKKAGIVVGAALSIVLVCIGAVILWKQYHNHQIFYDVYEQQQDPEVSLGQLKRFSFRELQIATDHFHNRNILGKGGFGYVYKGCLPDGSVVAVKRLRERNTGGELQFQTEIEMISLAVHRNLLRLLGCCVTSTERLLVYPYMHNGSVASHLKKKPSLDWPTRKRIALGAGRGLLYLHEQCDPKIIHRDVKAANILLDEDYEAVVGDFGLAKLLDHKQSHVTTMVRGTVGHIAPEYLSTGQSSEKTDVFGFGILLFELITGQRAIDFGRLPNQKGYALLEWVKKLQMEKRLCELVDSEVHDDYNAVELEQIVQVALLCTQYLPVDRPKMSEVMHMLVGDGLVEHWEAWQKTQKNRTQAGEQWFLRYFNLTDETSNTIEALELSGPR